MAAEVWKLGDDSYALYVDTKHTRIIENIKRSRNWEIMAKYQKNGRVVAIQWRIPASCYRVAKHIVEKCT